MNCVFGLKKKLVLLVSTLLIGSIVVISAISYVRMNEAYNGEIHEMQNGFDTKIQTAVEDLVSVLQVNYQRYTDGEITKQQAIENAKDIVRNTRYDSGNGYFWADSADGTCAVHMNSKNEGAKRYNNQDEKGNYYIRNLITAGNNKNGGFTEFYYPKPGETEATKKRAFTMFFKPYGWYISTGNYYDDMNAAIAKVQNEKTMAMTIILISCVGICVIGSLLALMIAAKISKPISGVTNRLKLLADGDVKTEPAPISESKDETGQLTRAAESVILQLRGVIEDITSQLKEVSEGNMTAPVTYEYIGDYIPILNSIQNIKESLNNTLLTIESSAEQVSVSAESISSMTQYIASGASEQTGSIEEISSSIGSVSDSAKINAEKSRDAAQNVEKTTASIQESDKVMEKLIKSMGDIKNATGEIGKITSLIEGIAFQTNILSLNASIEAARAGENGRGFAVVAEEVRILAEKSSDAVKQAEKLVKTSQGAVLQGTGIASEMSGIVKHSVEMMQSTENSILDIGKKSEEQAESITEIYDNISNISNVVQTNASSAQEGAASSKELSAQTEILYNELAKFKLIKKEDSFD
ncbi:MAG: cache domain-containing protein [Clostridia bacterium]|jgi:methyl-accepting chemotaxis protein|nr:cache domain-containing protein [Clostridia bacterium]MCI1998898.1 cache domain-containing protein [Clostridia bacterium]MCI2013648.1 cache domain-containing protein [Clostridia bacterium]